MSDGEQVELVQSESGVHVNYGSIQGKGITIIDIPPDTVPRLFLESLLRSFNTGFKFFFDEFVIECNRKILRDEVLCKRCSKDVRRYQESISSLLASTSDKRTLNAIIKELKMLERCKRKKMPRIPFLGMNSRKKKISDDLNSPIRVFVSVQDKIDMRAGASLLGIPLSQYTGELIAEGMLRMFIRGSTTPEERAILSSSFLPDVPEDKRQQCVEILYERIIHEYKASLFSIYGSNVPRMRDDFDMIGLDRIMRGELICIDIATTPPCMTLPIVHGDIDPPPSASSRISILDDRHVVDGAISENIVDSVIQNNRERIMGKPMPMDAPIANPLIRTALDRFRDTISQKYMMKETRISEIWKESKTIIRHQIESIARVNGVDLERVNMESILGDVSKSMTFILIQHGILDSSSEDYLDVGPDLIKKIKCEIDDATNDGGITKTDLRRKIGRNHIKYMSQIDDILSFLIESGKYAFQNGKFIAFSGDYGSRMVPCSHRGRPPKNKDKEIIRVVEGRLSDYVPIPEGKK